MRYRVYIKPFDDDGNYQPDFIEVTDHVTGIGAISQTIDASEYNVGLFKNSGFQIKLRNDNGYFSEVGQVRSIFRFKRKDSQVKVTWDVADHDLICGFFECGQEVLGQETEIFRGVINDISSFSSILDQQAVFSILGFDSMLSGVLVPFASISNGELLSSIIYKCLNQAPFNELVTVDALNIDLGNDIAIDSKDDFENRPVSDVLPDLSLAANSVVYLKNNVVYVTPRDESDDLKYTFYGQASNNGIENVLNIPKLRDGINRVFNNWFWTETSVFSRAVDSIDTYGIRKKEVSLAFIDASSTAKIQSILDANMAEFSFPKTELELETPLNYDRLDLEILDKIQIDYPTVYTSFDGNPLPRYGAARYGQVRYPYGLWALTIDRDRRFKILGRKIDPTKNTLMLTLREI